jgi:helicase
MPQGPRVFKFLIKKDVEKYLPPEDALKLLRKAGAIYLARGDEVMEKKFIELLGAYQLSYRRVSICNHCLGERRVTYVGKDAIIHKGSRICETALLLSWSGGGLPGAYPGRASLTWPDLEASAQPGDVLGLLSMERLDPLTSLMSFLPAKWRPHWTWNRSRCRSL